MASPKKLNEKKITEYLAAEGLSWVDVRVYDRVTSTNTLMKTAAEGGAAHGRVILARRQTAGRGRMGRTFYSPEDTGLYVSILIRPRLAAEDCLLLTPLAAVAACRALEASGCPQVDVKWVNDIYVGDKKGAGILVEGSFSADGGVDYAVVGIGLNLFPPKKGFPDDIAHTACAFFDSGAALDVNRLAADLIRCVFGLYESLPNRDFMDEYRSRSCLIGRDVTVTRGDEEFFGRAVSVDDSARLAVECDDGVLRLFDSGEARAKRV